MFLLSKHTAVLLIFCFLFHWMELKLHCTGSFHIAQYRIHIWCLLIGFYELHYFFISCNSYICLIWCNIVSLLYFCYLFYLFTSSSIPVQKSFMSQTLPLQSFLSHIFALSCNNISVIFLHQFCLGSLQSYLRFLFKFFYTTMNILKRMKYAPLY